MSKFLDPIFAIFVGTAAAALRIRREEKEKYPEQNNDWSGLWAKAVRMRQDYFNGYNHEK